MLSREKNNEKLACTKTPTDKYEQTMPRRGGASYENRSWLNNKTQLFLNRFATSKKS